jgi:hypothetical protein
MASEYARNFEVTLTLARPALETALARVEATRPALVQAYLETLSEVVDPDVERRAGRKEAEEVSRMAAGVLKAGGVGSRRGLQAMFNPRRHPAPERPARTFGHRDPGPRRRLPPRPRIRPPLPQRACPSRPAQVKSRATWRKMRERVRSWTNLCDPDTNRATLVHLSLWPDVRSEPISPTWEGVVLLRIHGPLFFSTTGAVIH